MGLLRRHCAKRKPSQHHDASQLVQRLNYGNRSRTRRTIARPRRLDQIASDFANRTGPLCLDFELRSCDLTIHQARFRQTADGSAAALDDSVVGRDRDAKISRWSVCRAVDGRDATGVQQMQNESAAFGTRHRFVSASRSVRSESTPTHRAPDRSATPSALPRAWSGRQAA